MLMLPEIVVIVTAFAVLLLDLFISEKQRVILAPLAMAGLLAALLTVVFLVPLNGTMFGGRFAMDPVAWWFKVMFLLAGLVTVILSRDLLDGRVGLRMRGIGFRGVCFSVWLFS
ncbi:MAG: hypothetical protein RBU21_10805, partial [FCB group bacterium]|nr:hypothetical protein [FCB group bacterium]